MGYHNAMEKIDCSCVRRIRYAVQWAIVFFLLYAGYEFSRFVSFYAAGGTGVSPVGRPPSVEGFLPIGALMSLKLWVTTGIFDRIHPAGLVIFVAALLLAFVLKKAFCGWICPVGTISEAVWKLGGKMFGCNFSMPRVIDYSLRILKYVLMGFFIYIVVVQMPAPAIAGFLASDYYKIADVKMLYFFTRMTTDTAVVLSVFVVLSLFFKNFWCRYLCPYGALLGLISMCSPVKITRNDNVCIHCGRCAKHCPSLLPVDRMFRVRSPECTGCLTCVSHCPAKSALDASVTRKKALRPLLYVAIAVIVFFGIIGVARFTGKWNSAVTPSDYARVVPRASLLEHP
jgi:polyferredoxin